MNHVFQVVWSKETGKWVVASELATRGTRGPGRSRRALARKGSTRIAAALIAVLGPLSAHAQSLHWDGTDSDANANGGNGTWQTGTTNWDSAASGGANTAWSSILPNDAIFGGTAGTVTIAAGGVTVGNVAFNTSGYTVGGGPLTLIGGISSTGTTVINSVIAGTNGLVKHGDGTLLLAADTALEATQILGGTLEIGTGATLSSRDTLLAEGAVLRIDGTFPGTDAGDTFQSAGTVIGSLAFGAGDDRIDFSGGTLDGLAAIDGGDGSDALDLRGLTLSAMPALGGMERISLRDGTSLALSQALQLAGGVLAIDATSWLEAGPGARIGGSVENAGTLGAGSGRLMIDGDYTGLGDATLTLRVSPGLGTSGGLDIAGDVHGTTRVGFDSDGTTAHGATSIKVIDSPNDVAGDGTFVAADARDAFVRLPGSALNWVFGQDAADGNWYLRTEGFGEGSPALLPELPAYGALSTIGVLASRASSATALRHVANACDRSGDAPAQAGVVFYDRCDSAWAAASVDEVRVGSRPGAAFRGDRHGLYLGADILGHEDETNVWRGGVFVGLQRGNDWTTGAASGGLAAVAGANVRSESHAFGAYASAAWESGWHLEGTTVGQLNEASIVAVDGFSQGVVGESMAFDVRAGRAFTTGAGWTLDPSVQVGVVGMRWRDLVDASGKQVLLDDDVLTTARAELRAERTFATAGGTQWQPWATLGIENTVGDDPDALQVVQDDVAQAFPNHALGTRATLDLGLEVRTSARVAVFGTVSWGTSLTGTDIDGRQATFGARLRW